MKILIKALDIFLGVSGFILIVLISYYVVTRYVFHMNFNGFEEITLLLEAVSNGIRIFETVNHSENEIGGQRPKGDVPSGMVNYRGNYNYYLEQKEAGNIEADSDDLTRKEETDASKTGLSSKEEWLRSREEAARQRKLENDLKKTEKKINQLEEENEKIQEEINLPENSTDAEKLTELSARLEQNEEALLKLYEDWENLQTL